MELYSELELMCVGRKLELCLPLVVSKAASIPGTRWPSGVVTYGPDRGRLVRLGVANTSMGAVLPRNRVQCVPGLHVLRAGFTVHV